MPSKASKPAAPKPTDTQLTPRQALFVREYLVDLNCTQAAIRSGYSPKTAGSQGFDLLKIPEIAHAVSIAKDKRADKVGISAEMALTQAARMALADPRHFVDEDGNPIPIQHLSDEAAACVQGFEIAADGTIKYKITDKNSALDKLFKHLGLYEKDNTQSGTAIGQLLGAIHGAGSRLETK